MPCDPRHTTLVALAKLAIWAIFGRFQFGPFLDVFVGYNPRFSSPATISMPCDPRYTTLEASAKLVFLAISEIGRASCRERVCLYV